MVVDDLDVIYMAVSPYETEAPLIVDSDTPLTFAVALELLEMIRRRYEKVVQRHRGIEHEQLSERDSLDVRWQSTRSLPVEQLLGLGIRPAPYHAPNDNALQ
jgi:hypothetical protein